MQTRIELTGKHGIDRAVAGHPALPGEGGADQQHRVMGFAPGPRAGMAGMLGAVIAHPQQAGGEAGAEQGIDTGGTGYGFHAAFIGEFAPTAKREVANPAGRSHKTPMTRRPTRARAYAPDPDAPGRGCEMPDCKAMGEYRAPKSKQDLRQYFWFCLEHVRAYNLSWDYYKGMSPGEIEAALRQDTAWGRPTWPLGRIGSAAWEGEALRDPLHILAAGGVRTGRGKAHALSNGGTPSELREPLAALGLNWPTTMDQLKTRYKELAKRHHPDANHGDKGAEERIKTINLAYAKLRTRLTAEPGLAAAG